MKRFKRWSPVFILTLITVLLFTQTVSAVTFNPDTAVKVKKVAFNRTAVTLTRGQKITLKATVTPSNAVRKTVKWTSSNTRIATVTNKGVVKGVKAGTATITARAIDGCGKKAVCRITVRNPVTNVNDTILNMTAVQAANRLGFFVRMPFGHRAYRVMFSKTSMSSRDRTRSSIKCIRKEENKKGAWDFYVKDKTVTFYGIRLGMTKKQAVTLMTKANWRKRKEVKDEEGYIELTYSPRNTRLYGYKYKGELSISVNSSGKIYRMDYYVDIY